MVRSPAYRGSRNVTLIIYSAIGATRNFTFVGSSPIIVARLIKAFESRARAGRLSIIRRVERRYYVNLELCKYIIMALSDYSAPFNLGAREHPLRQSPFVLIPRRPCRGGTKVKKPRGRLKDILVGERASGPPPPRLHITGLCSNLGELFLSILPSLEDGRSPERAKSFSEEWKEQRLHNLVARARAQSGALNCVKRKLIFAISHYRSS